MQGIATAIWSKPIISHLAISKKKWFLFSQSYFQVVFHPCPWESLGMTHSDWYTPKAGSANTFLRDCALTVKNISSFVIDECHQSDKHCTRNLSPHQNSIPKTESTISQHTGLLVHNFFVKGCILTYYLQNMWISTILDDFFQNLLQFF